MELDSNEIKEKDYCLLSERPILDINTLLNIYGNKVREEHQKISSTLDMAVEEFKRKNPEKYDMAQIIGNDIMDKIYDLQEGRDTVGDKLKAKELYNIYLDGMITIDEMEEKEKNLMEEFYGIK